MVVFVLKIAKPVWFLYGLVQKLYKNWTIFFHRVDAIIIFIVTNSLLTSPVDEVFVDLGSVSVVTSVDFVPVSVVTLAVFSDSNVLTHV